MLEASLENLVERLHAVLWGWPVLALILLAGLNLSFRLNFFQFTHCILWIKNTICKIFCRKQSQEEGLSPFQALTTALAGSIGTGNIVGVATAITIGGPGAIFWMWISAVFGMASIFAETVLGVKCRVWKQGEWQGGAMYYLERGLHAKPLAIVFSVGCVLASFGMGNMAQSNSIGAAMQECFHFPPLVCGAIAAVLLLAVSLGGVKRVGRVTEKLVPLMAVGYVAACIVVLFANRNMVGSAFREIFRGAFGLQAAAGGVSGTILAAAARIGLSRGIFTNEAGLGSSSLAHSSSSGKEPVEQGMWAIFQVFLDTLVMCTLTALVILSSGVSGSGKDGAALSAAAFGTVFGEWGGAFVAIAITVFAFATMLGWCYYGERGVRYLGGQKAVPVYRGLFALCAVVGCLLKLQVVWDLCDLFNALMALPNLAALFLMGGQVQEEVKRYLTGKRKT